MINGKEIVYGEECDDGPSGSATCTSECKKKIVAPSVCGDRDGTEVYNKTV